jgi:hypothetical protein
MGMLNNLIDTALMVGNVLSIKENHTEARTKEEKQKQRERRRNISDIRNAAFLIKRFIR